MSRKTRYITNHHIIPKRAWGSNSKNNILKLNNIYYFNKKIDGLKQSWKGHNVFMNPPYSKEISKWIEKAYKESLQENTCVVCLIPSRTDTKWWHDYVMKGEITFIRGRLKFGNSKNSAPFPSAIVVFKKGDIKCV